MTNHAALAYDATAPFYDVLTRGDDYSVFSRMLHGLIEQAGPPGKRLLDAGCGNGRSSLEFAAHGYRVTGTDVSAAMIETARLRHADSGIDFHVQDVRHPVPHGPYDVVVCMSDIVNYLLTPEDLAAAFGSIAAALRPGGVLVFDANTAHGYELMTTPHVIDAEDAFVTMRGRRAEGEFRIAIDVFRPAPGEPGQWTRDFVEHRQAHHGGEEFEELLRKAGMRLTAGHGLHISGRLEDRIEEDSHTKGLYVAVREHDA